MSDLIIVIGPPAVGKMTVGQALSERTGYPLFHNHMSIELALKFFPFGTDGFRRISGTVRETVFEAVRNSDLAGLIFTFAWAFNEPDDRRYMESLRSAWQSVPANDLYFLELAASEAARQERNRHPDRLVEKPSKRDLDRSETLRRRHDRDYDFNSNDDFPLSFPHLKINNTALPPGTVADRFLKRFELKCLP